MAMSAYVYKGFGASEQGCVQLYNALKRHLPEESYNVDYITPEEIVNDTKLKTASLISFGGGFTSGFAKTLGDTGIANLKAYVHNGGAYLGFGGGGYFGCDYIEFDVGGPYEKLCERDLRLFPGVGRGPVFPGFEYGSNKGVNAALVTFQSPFFNGTFHAFCDGGGAFILSESPKAGSEVTKVTPIATFQSLEDTPTAIVKTDVGHKGGKAVLSGVHLEYDTLFVVRSDSNLAAMEDRFENSNENQREALKSVLILLGLEVI